MFLTETEQNATAESSIILRGQAAGRRKKRLISKRCGAYLEEHPMESL